MRNSALIAAYEFGAKYLFSIDSDVILETPDTLAHLIEADVPVIAGVFMAKWGNSKALALPNVWQSGHNSMSDDFLATIATADKHVEVGGLGACTLIRRDVWTAGISYSEIPFLSSVYHGEDRYFSLRAAVAGIPLAACAHTKITHVERS